jgi:hypothetical protein
VHVTSTVVWSPSNGCKQAPYCLQHARHNIFHFQSICSVNLTVYLKKVKEHVRFVMFCIHSHIFSTVVSAVSSVLSGVIHPDAVVLTHHHPALETLIFLYMKESLTSLHFSESVENSYIWLHCIHRNKYKQAYFVYDDVSKLERIGKSSCSLFERWETEEIHNKILLRSQYPGQDLNLTFLIFKPEVKLLELSCLVSYIYIYIYTYFFCNVFVPPTFQCFQVHCRQIMWFFSFPTGIPRVWNFMVV